MLYLENHTRGKLNSPWWINHLDIRAIKSLRTQWTVITPHKGIFASQIFINDSDLPMIVSSNSDTAVNQRLTAIATRVGIADDSYAPYLWKHAYITQKFIIAIEQYDLEIKMRSEKHCC